jgi:hypothetical protein
VAKEEMVREVAKTAIGIDSERNKVNPPVVDLLEDGGFVGIVGLALECFSCTYMVCIMGLFEKGSQGCIWWQDKKWGGNQWNGDIDNHARMVGRCCG